MLSSPYFACPGSRVQLNHGSDTGCAKLNYGLQNQDDIGIHIFSRDMVELNQDAYVRASCWSQREKGVLGLGASMLVTKHDLLGDWNYVRPSYLK